MAFTPMGFWALKCESERTYTQDLEDTFKLTMAALGHDAPKNKPVTLYIRYEETEIAVCTLNGGKVDQQPLDLTFTEGESVTFMVRGGVDVYLTGNYLVDLAGDLPEDMYEDDEEIVSDLEDDEEEEVEAEATMVEEEPKKVEAKEAKKPEPKKEAKKQPEPVVEEEDEEEIDDEELEALRQQLNAEEGLNIESIEELKEMIAEGLLDDDEDDDEEMEEEEEKPQPKRKNKEEAPVANKKAKQEEKKPKEDKKKEENKENNVKKLPSGLVMEDVKVGKGPLAKQGKKVSVRYIGKLQNGKVFDANTKGAPFQFKLGAGQVIKGWDIGVQGMHVGGTRKLTIPAALAYGAKGAAPDIPPNATLVFEVRLLDVKN